MNNDGEIFKEMKFIRNHRIDEIPQFYNIIKGEMSLIGPRPEPKEYFEEIINQFPIYKNRYQIKPGLTGLAQTKFKHTTTVSDAMIKYEFDIKYIENISILNDLKIVLNTILIIFNSRGAK